MALFHGLLALKSRTIDQRTVEFWMLCHEGGATSKDKTSIHHAAHLFCVENALTLFLTLTLEQALRRHFTCQKNRDVAWTARQFQTTFDKNVESQQQSG